MVCNCCALALSSCAPEPTTLVTSPTLTAMRTSGAPTESPGPAATIAPRTPAADTEGEIVARTLTGHTIISHPICATMPAFVAYCPTLSDGQVRFAKRCERLL